jgi:hypothetical protein
MNPDGPPRPAGVDGEEENMMERNVAIGSLIFGVSMLAIGCAQTKASTPSPKHPTATAADADGPAFADVLDAADAPPAPRRRRSSPRSPR